MKKSLLINFIIAITFLVSCGSADDDGMSDIDNQNPTAPQELIAFQILPKALSI